MKSLGLEKRLVVDPTRTAEFSPDWLCGATLIVRPATIENKAYHAENDNILVEQATKSLNKARKMKKGDAKTRAVERCVLRLAEAYVVHFNYMFPKHIVVGWTQLADEDGTEVEYNEENAVKVVAQITPHEREFAQLLRYVNDPDNFRDIDDGVFLDDIEELAEEISKNS